jgi:hypothetical protein
MSEPRLMHGSPKPHDDQQKFIFEVQGEQLFREGKVREDHAPPPFGKTLSYLALLVLGEFFNRRYGPDVRGLDANVIACLKAIRVPDDEARTTGHIFIGRFIGRSYYTFQS